LPADLPGSGRAHLRERLPRHHRAVSRPLQFLRRQRQAKLHPFRDSVGRDHPLRHLQPVLPQRKDRRHPRRTGGTNLSGGTDGGRRAMSERPPVVAGPPPASPPPEPPKQRKPGGGGCLNSLLLLLIIAVLLVLTVIFGSVSSFLNKKWIGMRELV